MNTSSPTRLGPDLQRHLLIHNNTLSIGLPPSQVEQPNSRKECSICCKKNPYNRLFTEVNRGKFQTVHTKCLVHHLADSENFLSMRNACSHALNNNIIKVNQGQSGVQRGALSTQEIWKTIEQPIPDHNIVESLKYEAIMLKGCEESPWMEKLRDANLSGLHAPVTTDKTTERKNLLLEALRYGEDGTLFMILASELQGTESYTINRASSGSITINRHTCLQRAAELNPSPANLSAYWPLMGPNDLLNLKNGQKLTKQAVYDRLTQIDIDHIAYNSLEFAISHSSDQYIKATNGKSYTKLQLLEWLLEQNRTNHKYFTPAFRLCAQYMKTLESTEGKPVTIQYHGQPRSARFLLIEAVNNTSIHDYHSYEALAKDMTLDEKVTLRQNEQQPVCKRVLSILALQGFYEKEYDNHPSKAQWARYMQPIIDSLKGSQGDVVPISQHTCTRASSLEEYLNSDMVQFPIESIQHHNPEVLATQINNFAHKVLMFLKVGENEQYGGWKFYLKAQTNDHWTGKRIPTKHQKIPDTVRQFHAQPDNSTLHNQKTNGTGLRLRQLFGFGKK